MTTALLSRQDIHVNVGRWQWRPTDEWPPLNAVLATPFWKADAYAEVRGRLQRPAPEMRLETGRQFHTLQLRGGTASLAQGDPLHAAEEEGDVGMPPDVEVCSCVDRTSFWAGGCVAVWVATRWGGGVEWHEGVRLRAGMGGLGARHPFPPGAGPSSPPPCIPHRREWSRTACCTWSPWRRGRRCRRRCSGCRWTWCSLN